MTAFVAWTAVIFGTPLALITLVHAALPKLLPASAMTRAKVMYDGFEYVWGPFLGCVGTATPTRIFVGIGELMCSLTLLVFLWSDVDTLNLLPWPLVDLGRGLVIVCGTGLFITYTTATLVHMYTDGSPKMDAACLAGLSLFITLWCMFLNGPDLYQDKVLCTLLCLCEICGAVLTVVVNRKYGQHQSFTAEANADLNKLMNGGS